MERFERHEKVRHKPTGTVYKVIKHWAKAAGQEHETITVRDSGFKDWNFENAEEFERLE